MNEVVSLLDYAARRGFGEGPWLRELHPKQKAFVADPAKSKCGVAGRRSGKTFAACAGLYDAALKNANSVALYLALTAKSARNILWRELRNFDRLYGLKLEFNETQLIAKLPNGSEIHLAGADTAGVAERLRGLAYCLVVVDEAASFRRGLLQYLIEEVIEPGLADFDGSLWLIGSPGAACVGYFFEASTGLKPGWETHHWDLRDNPRFKGRGQSLLERKLRDKNWTWDTPAFRREWLGLWTKDPDSLVYRFSRETNAANDVTAVERYVLAVDLGASAEVASTAFCLLGFGGGVCWVLRSWKEAGLTPSDIGERIQGLNERYKFDRIVVDQGGLGAGYIAEFRKRFQLPVHPVEKRDKLAFIELLNGDLRAGKVKLVASQNEELIAELELLQWDDDRKKPDERYADHLCDAMLYGWRECRHWIPEPEQEKAPEDDGDEYVEKLMKKGKGPWWRKTG